MQYDLELDRIVKEIKKNNAKRVCIQLADGLKPKAKEITEKIEKATKTEVIIWMGSCYGACDIPLELKKLGVDMLVHFGHTKY